MGMKAPTGVAVPMAITVKKRYTVPYLPGRKIRITYSHTQMKAIFKRGYVVKEHEARQDRETKRGWEEGDTLAASRC